MLKHKMKFNNCGRITALVILMSFLMRFPVFGEQPMTQTPNSSESGTRLYSDLEIDLLIEDLSTAAEEAIERAAAEAAKAAALASLEREAAAIREAARQQAEAIRWQSEAEAAKRNEIKNTVIAGVVCFLGGLAVGVGGTLIIGGR